MATRAGCVCVLLALHAGRLPPDVQFTDTTKAMGIAFTPRQLRDLEQIPGRDDGRRRGAVRLRQRRTARRVLHQRREDRRPDASEGRPDKSDPRIGTGSIGRRADGTFDDVTEKAGLTGPPQNQYGMGVAVGDYDNDGFADLYVTNYGGNTLYRNNGDGTFADVTARAGVGGRRLERERRVLRLRQRRPPRSVRHALRRVELPGAIATAARRSLGYRAYCHPDNFEAVANVLFRNNGDGTFTDVSAKAGIAGAPGKGLGVAFADYDDDGWIDVYVANDSVQSFLFRNSGKGTFTRRGAARGRRAERGREDVRRHGRRLRDYDNDGRPDVFVTDLSNERYRLFRHNGDGSFRDATNASGVGGATLAVLGLEHAVLRLRQRRLEGHLRRAGTRDGHDREDVAQPALPAAAAAAAQRVRALRPRARRRRPSGRTGPGRGAAFGDLDNDGDVDVVVSNVGQQAIVLRNDGGNRQDSAGSDPPSRRRGIEPRRHRLAR